MFVVLFVGIVLAFKLRKGKCYQTTYITRVLMVKMYLPPVHVIQHSKIVAHVLIRSHGYPLLHRRGNIRYQTYHTNNENQRWLDRHRYQRMWSDVFSFFAKSCVRSASRTRIYIYI